MKWASFWGVIVIAVAIGVWLKQPPLPSSKYVQRLNCTLWPAGSKTANISWMSGAPECGVHLEAPVYICDRGQGMAEYLPSSADMPELEAAGISIGTYHTRIGRWASFEYDHPEYDQESCQYIMSYIYYDPDHDYEWLMENMGKPLTEVQ